MLNIMSDGFIEGIITTLRALIEAVESGTDEVYHTFFEVLVGHENSFLDKDADEYNIMLRTEQGLLRNVDKSIMYYPKMKAKVASYLPQFILERKNELIAQLLKFLKSEAGHLMDKPFMVACNDMDCYDWPHTDWYHEATAKDPDLFERRDLTHDQFYDLARNLNLKEGNFRLDAAVYRV